MNPAPYFRNTRPPMTGAFGATDVRFTPQAQRQPFTVDVTNCLHCGGHHVSADARLMGDRLVVECPALGGRPITMTLRLFLHKYPGRRDYHRRPVTRILSL